MIFERQRCSLAAHRFTSTSAVLGAAVSALVLAAAGCAEPPPIPTTGSDVRRALMEPDTDVKVRRLIELSKQSKEQFDLPTTRQTLVEATQSAQKLGRRTELCR